MVRDKRPRGRGRHRCCSRGRLWFGEVIDLDSLLAGLLNGALGGPVVCPDGRDASLVGEVLRQVRGALLGDHQVWLGGGDLVTDLLNVGLPSCNLVGVRGLQFGLIWVPVVLVVGLWRGQTDRKHTISHTIRTFKLKKNF